MTIFHFTSIPILTNTRAILCLITCTLVLPDSKENFQVQFEGGDRVARDVDVNGLVL